VSRVFWFLSGFYLFFFAIIGVYVIYLPKVLANLGYEPWQIGIIFAMSPLMRFLIPFLFLKHLHLTFNLYKISLLLLIFAAAITFLTIHSFWLFLIPNILLGIAFALSLPYVETVALATIKKERYGKARLFGSIGFIIIALVLAKFMDKSSYALLFLLLTALGTALFGLFLPPIKHLTKKTKEPFSIKKEWRLWLNLFLMQVSFGPFYNFFTIYEKSHGLDYESISYLWSFGVVCEIILFFFQAPLMRKNLFYLIQFATFTAIIRWLLLFFYPTNLFALYFAQTLHAFSFALYYSAAISYLFILYKNKTLAQQFFGGISFGLGGMVGSFLAGLFYGEYLFLYAAFVAFLAWIVLFKSLFNKQLSISKADILLKF